MLKKYKHAIIGGVMYSFLLVFLSMSCVHIMTGKQKLNNNDDVIELQTSAETTYDNNNFALFEKLFLLNEDEGFEYCTTDDECDVETSKAAIISSASGGSIKAYNGKIYALTAAHFCSDYDEPPIEGEGTSFHKVFTVTYRGLIREAFIEKMDENSDLCLMSFEKEGLKSIDHIKLADNMPEIGETVYTVSAPLGIAGNTFRIHFDGKFSGCDNYMGCLYTIPATYGSSGSLVLNNEGELISMIQVSIIPFKEVSAGPSVQKIRIFLYEYYVDTGIKLH